MTGAAGGFGVGAVAGFFDAVGAEGVGMALGPAVGAERSQVTLAGQQAVEDVFHIQPDVCKRAPGPGLWR